MQPPPPHILFEALTEPRRPAGRPWLDLLDDEVDPHVIDAHTPNLVMWSSIFTKRPDAQVRFELTPAGGETDLTWILYVEPPEPDAMLTGHMRKRMNEL